MVLKNRFHLTYCEEYGMWLTLMRACYNPKSSDYKNFGAKGLYLCKRWQTFFGFRNSAFFKGDQKTDKFVLYFELKGKPHKDCRPKRLCNAGVNLYRLSFAEIETRKQQEIDRQVSEERIRLEKEHQALKRKEERIKKEQYRLANQGKEDLLKKYCPGFFKFACKLDYDFNYEWLVSFDDSDKLKFLLKYSRKSNKTIPIESMDYYVEFINHFYYDEQFNKVYDNWLSTQDSRVIPSLDHIHPQSKGGSHELENLRFITNIENYFKLARSLEEWEYIKNNPDKFFI